jgi:hypothetical protein
VEADNIKIKNFILNLISIVIIGTMTFLCFKNNNNKLVTPDPAVSGSELGLTIDQIKYIQKLSQAPTYDYHHLLGLMEKYRKIERSFYGDFSLFINNPKNLKNLRKSLREFEIERSFFKKYLKQTNQYYSRSSVPTRKRNSLQYYFRVLEDNIDHIKKMIERFNLHIKIQAKIAT